MKLMIPFLMALLPVASVAQSQSGAASGIPALPYLQPPKYSSFRLPGRA
jgi:hypothetical protein